VYTKTAISLTITVLDQDGEPVGGATVVLDGCNIVTAQGKQVHGVTDTTGKVMFTGLSASQTDKSVGFVTVTVTKSGMGTDSSLTLPVISE
jgi:protocatechuate 3,4-dioxygenase beta subunit